MKNRTLTNIFSLLLYIFSVVVIPTSIALAVIMPIVTKKLYFILVFLLILIVASFATKLYHKIMPILNYKNKNINDINHFETILSNVSLALIFVCFTMLIVFGYFLLLFRAFRWFVLTFLVIAIVSGIYAFNLIRVMREIKQIKKQIIKEKA